MNKYKIGLLALIAVLLAGAFVLNSSFINYFSDAMGIEEEIETATVTDAEKGIIGTAISAEKTGDGYLRIKQWDRDYEIEEVVPLDEDTEKSGGDGTASNDDIKDISDDAGEVGDTNQELAPDDMLMIDDDMELLGASSSGSPTYRSVGNLRPADNSADWWRNAQSYIASHFGVVDGQYNTSSTAPSSGSMWCAGLVSRVMNATYPNGSKIAITESVENLYSNMVSTGDYTYIGEGHVDNFVDIITGTKAGDIMLFKTGGRWTHVNIITYYGYIYSQGANQHIRMNTFDSYNKYGAYDSSLSSGYYFYIYRPKEVPVNVGPFSLKKVIKPGYSLYTQDSSRYSLAGARYTITNSDGSSVWNLVTDASGVAHVADSS